MATLEALKAALRQKAKTLSSSSTQELSDDQYAAGFELVRTSPGSTAYQDFITPQLSQLLSSLLESRPEVSILEIGPGERSILADLPEHQKQRIKRYVAYEPRGRYATELEEWLPSTGMIVEIHHVPFAPASINVAEKFDLILFCHSMYGMQPRDEFIKTSLKMLHEKPEGSMVVVFHREGGMPLNGLVCSRTASFPAGIVLVPNEDDRLDRFAAFIAGFVISNEEENTALNLEWRKICRALGRLDATHPGYIMFSSPEMMVALTRHATALPELIEHMPTVGGSDHIKNRQARVQGPAAIIRPNSIEQVQQCVRWALKHDLSLTVVSGGHSGHCLQPNVVAVDMGAFDDVDIVPADEIMSTSATPFVFVGAGCKTKDIIHKTAAIGVTVPLGSRPSVGAGLWLQGGFGHLARLYGLACDAIVGAVVVSVATGEVVCVGHVPARHQPAGANIDSGLLWAVAGAGTNMGVVVGVVFKTSLNPTHVIRKWFLPLDDTLKMKHWLQLVDEEIAIKLPRGCSVDLYLYSEADKLNLGITIFESSSSTSPQETLTSMPAIKSRLLGPETSSKTVEAAELFDAEMFVSEMHGGHTSGKTSSFKRCVFLKGIGSAKVALPLAVAVVDRPSSLCYIHLIQGGGAVTDVEADATAFGCRDWDFACVVTGVWPRDKDGTDVARSAVQWVYNTVNRLLPSSSGSYSADLGPDPRDSELATKAFGPNLPHLTCIKQRYDPKNVLSHVCPLPKPLSGPRVLLLVTGKSCAGKDHCARIWAWDLVTQGLKVRAVSISDDIKREYAAVSDVDLERLLEDQTYKEQHRSTLSDYYEAQVQQRPQLPQENFLKLVRDAADLDVLLITGMRDQAPVAAYSHLAPRSKSLEVCVQASNKTRNIRRGQVISDEDHGNGSSRPDLIFNNDLNGHEAVTEFCKDYLHPLLHDDLKQLVKRIQTVPDFPRKGIKFVNVLGVLEQHGGLNLCTSLLQTQFRGDWAKVDAIACCEAGGFLVASALAACTDVPLVLIREAGKLPGPAIQVPKPSSHISTLAVRGSSQKMLEMGRDVICKDSSVVVVDDVLATGRTMLAVLQLLGNAGVRADDIHILVVAEFPAHRGRDFLHRNGFGRVRIQSLLTFGGA